MSNTLDIDSNKLAKIICADYPETKPSFLDNNNILWKMVDGDWIGKPVVKDPNHKGHRYIWEEEIA